MHIYNANRFRLSVCVSLPLFVLARTMDLIPVEPVLLPTHMLTIDDDDDDNIEESSAATVTADQGQHAVDDVRTWPLVAVDGLSGLAIRSPHSQLPQYLLVLNSLRLIQPARGDSQQHLAPSKPLVVEVLGDHQYSYVSNR